MGIIVSTFIGCGKTYLKNTYGNRVVIQESIPDGVVDDAYIQKTLDLASECDIVFVPSTREIRDVLNEHNVDYDLFYPSKSRRLEFIENQSRKRVGMQAIRDLDNNFDKWIDEIEKDESENCYKHKLENRNDFIGNDASIINYITSVQKNENQ